MDTAIKDLKTRLANTIARQTETLEKTKKEFEQLELLLETATPKK